MPTPTYADIAGIISAVANLGSFVAVGFGVAVAYTQLSNWRREASVKRKVEIAEAVISAAYEADNALRIIRNPWGKSAPTGDPNPKTFEWRERLERIATTKDAFDRLRTVQVQARAYLEDAEVDSAIKTLFSLRQELYAALGTLSSGTKTDGDRELLDFYNKLRRKVYGEYSSDDQIGNEQVRALSTLEQRLYPIMRME